MFVELFDQFIADHVFQLFGDLVHFIPFEPCVDDDRLPRSESLRMMLRAISRPFSVSINFPDFSYN